MHSAMHTKDRDAEPKVAGEPRSTKSTVLETGAAMTQARCRDIHYFYLTLPVRQSHILN